jgi:hypothetical protein
MPWDTQHEDVEGGRGREWENMDMILLSSDIEYMIKGPNEMPAGKQHKV